MDKNGSADKKNAMYNFSNGAINFQQNTNHSSNHHNHHNNNKPRKYSLTNGAYSKTPLDRMSSVTSSQYTTANSVLKLVNDDVLEEDSKSKRCAVYCQRRWKIMIFICLLISVIAALSAMYVLEKQHDKVLIKQVSQPLFFCFLKLLITYMRYNDDKKNYECVFTSPYNLNI